jgi:flagellar biosynthesis/type III secretory pathway protein FliH
MCDLSKGVFELGYKEGFEIGYKEGLELGRKEGTIAFIKTLMETLKLSLEQAMYALKIPEADRAHYLNTLNGK